MNTQSRLTLALLIATLSIAAPAWAATITWNNAAGGNWGSAGNWSPQQVPGLDDVAVIDTTATYTIVVVDTQVVGDLVLDNPNATLRIEGSTTTGTGTLRVANGFTNEGTIELAGNDAGVYAWLDITAGTLINEGTIRVLAGAGAPHYLSAALDNRGTFNVAADLFLQFNGGNHKNSGTMTVAAGAILDTTGTVFTHQSGGTLAGTGTLKLSPQLILEADLTVGDIGIDAAGLTVDGPGQLQLAAGPAFTLNAWILNAEVEFACDLLINSTVTINSAFGVPAGRTVRIEGSTTTGTGTLRVANGFTNEGTIELAGNDAGVYAWLDITAGTLINEGTIRVLAGAGAPHFLNAALDNRGTFNVAADLFLQFNGGNHKNSGELIVAAGALVDTTGTVFTHQSGGTLAGTGTLKLSPQLILEADLTVGDIGIDAAGLTVDGPGKLRLAAGPAFTLNAWILNAEVVFVCDLLINSTVTINSAFGVPAGRTVRIEGSTTTGIGTLRVANGFTNRGTIDLAGNDAGIYAWLDLTAGTLINDVSGILRVTGNTGGPHFIYAKLDNRGTFEVGRDVQLYDATSGIHLNSGVIRLTSNAALQVTGGTVENTAAGLITGQGKVDVASASLANNGTVAPGLSPGTLQITGSYPQSAGAKLDIEIGGFTAGTGHDQLAVSAAADLGGTVTADLINSFFPRKGDAVTFITYASRTGSFATVASAEPGRIAWEVQYGPTSAQLVVLNSAPTLAAIVNQTVNELIQLSVTASATDQDLPAQTLTYALDVSPTGMTINPSSGAITWTPTEAQGPGNYNVTVRVTDNGTPSLGHTTSFAVTVKEVNVAPQLVLPVAQNIAEQVELVFSINGTDADLPANALTYELVSGPTGATFNPATREFRWTPTEAQGPGPFTATFRVTDNNPDAVNAQQLNAQGDVSITVAEVNLRPTLAGINNQTAAEEALFSLTAAATDPDLPANALTYALDTAPTGMTINPTTGAISWTPTEAQGPGNFDVTVRVTDNGSPALFHTTSFSVAVNEVNLQPTLAGIGNQTANEQAPFSYPATATDPDLPANALTYALDTAPAGMTINPATGAISWTPTEAQGPGNFDVTVRVTDNGSPTLFHTTSFSVAVSEVNLPPVLTAVPNAVVHAGTPFATQLSATDPDLPANTFTYSLVNGPAGATASPAGLVEWNVPTSAASTQASFTVRVTDNGTPAQFDDEDFQLTITGTLAVLSTVLTGDQLAITWRAIPGRTYRLVSPDSLPATTWNPVPGNVPATAGTASKSVTIGSGPGGTFFQVEILDE